MTIAHSAPSSPCPPSQDALSQPAAAAPADPTAALAALADRYYEAQARYDPVYSATLIGDNRFDDRLPITIAPAHRRQRFAMYHRVQRELAAIPRDALSPADALTHELLAWQLQTRLGFERFHDHLLPLQQMDAVPLLLAIFADGQAEQPLQTVAQLDAYQAHRAASGVDRPGDREHARRHAARHRAAQACRRGHAQAAAPARQCHAGGQPFLDASEEPAGVVPRGRAAAPRGGLRRTVAKRVAPALRRLADFLEKEYLPAAATAPAGARCPTARPGTARVRDQTTSELSPDEIHAIGLKEVARIHGEMARLAAAARLRRRSARVARLGAHERQVPAVPQRRQILDAYRRDQRDGEAPSCRSCSAVAEGAAGHPRPSPS